MKQITARISRNERIARDIYRMRIDSAYLAKTIIPGQFVEARCSDKIDPLLRRPLGVHRIFTGGIELLYEVCGKGTKLLSEKKIGDIMDIIGPLGTGFSLPNAQYSIPDTILVAGGIGVAPLVALAHRLAHKKNIHVIIGAKTKDRILCEKEFKTLGCDVMIATDDGSRGRKGFITDLLNDFLQLKAYSLQLAIYACGPVGMLKEVARIAKGRCIPCQVSLEERMACGVGVCLGCPVKVRVLDAKIASGTRHMYKMVCKDGPVFDAEEILW